MAQSLANTVVIHAVCYMIGYLFQMLISVSHRNTDMCKRKHVDIVFSVSKSHRFILSETILPHHGPYTLGFSSCTGNDIRSKRIPAGTFAIKQMGSNFHHFLPVIKQSCLIDRIARYRFDFRQLQMQHLMHAFHLLIIYIHVHFVFFNKDQRNMTLFENRLQIRYIPSGQSSLINDLLITIEAKLSA